MKTQFFAIAERQRAFEFGHGHFPLLSIAGGILLICIVAFPVDAQAKTQITRSWRGTGKLTMTVTPCGETEGIFHNEEDGRATHVGNYHNVGDGRINLVTGAFSSGQGTMTAANGDTIDWVLSEDGTAVVITGGTGRFKNARGVVGFTPISQEDPVANPDGSITVVVVLRYRGTITY